MGDIDDFVKELSKEKHEKRIILGFNVLAALWRLFTFWKEKNGKDKNDE